MTRAVWNGAVIAESDDVVVVDGYTYFPREAVAEEYFVPSDHSSVCGWKGTASYFSLAVDGKTNTDAAWYYPHPKPGAVEVRGRLGFWRGVKIQDSPGDGAALPRRARWWQRDRQALATDASPTEGSVVTDVDDSTFLAATTGRWTLVDFHAVWCAPCRQFHPSFEAFATAHAERLAFARCDVDTSPETAAAVGISSIPTLVLFDPAGNEAGRITGVPARRDLEVLIKLAQLTTALDETP